MWSVGISSSAQPRSSLILLLGHCIVRSRIRLEDTPVERPELASAILANDADEQRIICLVLGYSVDGPSLRQGQHTLNPTLPN
ncbi:uncharacterized protein TrAFT101_004078 [Trichoderma asperellum]|uniref:Uncharacterized protein n=1 Tax=Trichoderma asperellum (strain ATCC 204424 / CBS 433.97 / NBRC 101777) TaxID=1042311 RepID=A0A2T3ZNT7_TRIA4|nr:hypothetical protein M441DRAFT_63746 [Trichoderma asperellum CBS 433.97]PTB46466.1 hypothetical protein M441DRAFT_63746 [Trichoderma asperellum CBS 433.97]UKZ88317.1 hypothetical protein TrAFT101_004078 [Trichoderma asperellum]